MCGIGGYMRAPGVAVDSSALLSRMLVALNHRGPDSSGAWTSPDTVVGLCHARLAILDLSPSGKQPMHDSTDDITIVFNGEIYNWRDLREKLERSGYRFRSSSDTEVLLNAYRHYGHAVLDHLRGMFAFCIYDRRTRELFCARDRVGKKPFVYAETGEGFFFASEIPALLIRSDVNQSINRAGVAGMLLGNVRHIVDPHTAYLGVHKLKPGHALVVKDGRILSHWRWWTPQARSARVSVADLRALVEECTKLRMVADVPVGAMLSGGVDSTAIVAIMQRVSREPVRTYALGSDAKDEDLRRARVAAARLGCVHKEFYFEPEGQLSVFQNLIRSLGEPIMLLPLAHAFELCQAIRRDGVRVVLAGHGADELFYGYTGHFRTANVSDVLGYVDALRRFIPRNLVDRLARFQTIRFALTNPGLRKAQHYRNRRDSDWGDLMSSDAKAAVGNVVADELAYWGQLAPSNKFIDESNFTSLLVENAHSVTTATDLPGMLASVEVRAPFLDQEMCAFAASVHYREKVPKSRDSGQLKLILKRALSDLVPADLLYAPKRGFGMGIQENAVFRGPWRSFAESLLNDPDDLDGLFEVQAIRSLWRRFRDGETRQASTIARLTAIQFWAQQVRRPPTKV